MGDWSDKLDYEQREYYGHFYDPDREEETEEENGDLISRERLINEWDDLGRRYAMPTTPIHKRAIREFPSADVRENRWIPVSEKLPEERQSVLVWCPQYKNIYCAYLEKEQWWIFGAFVQIVPNEVVAWMPLPHPWKGE